MSLQGAGHFGLKFASKMRCFEVSSSKLRKSQEKCPSLAGWAFAVFFQRSTVLHLRQQLTVLFHIGRIHQNDLIDDFERALFFAELHQVFAQ